MALWEERERRRAEMLAAIFSGAGGSGKA